MTKPDLNLLQNRDQLGKFLNHYGLLGEAAEIGVLTGDYARSIISTWNGRKLHLIDPWQTQSDEVYKEPVNHCDWNGCIESVKALCREYDGRLEMHQAFSPQAADLFEDGSLDVIYVDSNHSLEACRADLKAWWPKGACGSVFGLHDFRVDTVYPQNCEVKTAVLEFVAEHGLDLHYTPPCGSVWFIHP